MASNTQNIKHLCWISIQSKANSSESNLKHLEDYIKNVARQIGGFDEKTFNIKLNEKHNKHQCFVNFSSAMEVQKPVNIFENKKIHGSQLKCEYRKPGPAPSAKNDTKEQFQNTK